MINLSNSQKEQIDEAFLKLHNLFAEKNLIKLIQVEEEVILSSDPNFNFLAPSFDKESDVEKIERSEEFYARVYYGRPSDESVSPSSNQREFPSKVNVPDGWVRIITTEDKSLAIKQAKRIIFDGGIYTLDSPKATHGLLSRQFYDFWLKPKF